MSQMPSHPPVAIKLELHPGGLEHASEMTRSKLEGADNGKQEKAAVNYRPADSPREECDVCVYFEGQQGEAQAQCAKVAGTVQAADLCDLFAPLEQESPAEDQAPDEGAEPTPTGGGSPPPASSSGGKPPWLK